MKLKKVECPNCSFDRQDYTLEDLGLGTYQHEGYCGNCKEAILVIVSVSDPSDLPF